MLKQFTKSVAAALYNDPINEYTIEETSVQKGGRHNLFEIRRAVDASGVPVSVFTLRVKDVAAVCATSEEVKYVIDGVKRGVALLTQLRHPGILKVERPLVEEKKKLWFVTERVQGTLDIAQLGDMHIQMRLIELWRCVSAIEFMHDSAQILLLNFTTQSVFVTADGRWKIGDCIHAMHRTEFMTSPPPVPPAYGLCSLGAPILDYMPYEYVDATQANSNSVADSLFSFQGPSPALVFPDTDVYALVIVITQVLCGSRLFKCAGNPLEHQRQRSTVEGTVGRYFSRQLLQLPRPHVKSLASSGPFTSEPVQVLVALEGYDTLTPDAQFRLLKRIYDAIGSCLLCEPAVVRYVVPLMRRVSKQQAMLKYTVPILLQCCSTLPKAEFDKCLRDFFSALVVAIVRAPSLDAVAVLAQQLLEKFAVFSAHFSSSGDVTNFLLPLLAKSLEPGSTTMLTQLGLRELATLLHRASSGASQAQIQVPSGLGPKLIHVASTQPAISISAFECLDACLVLISTEGKTAVERGLVNMLCRPSLESTESCGSSQRAMATLHHIIATTSSDHHAAESIPLLSRLLLCESADLRAFGAEMIDHCVQPFKRIGAAPAAAAVPFVAPGGFTGHKNANDNMTLDLLISSVPQVSSSSSPGARNSADEDLMAAFGFK